MPSDAASLRRSLYLLLTAVAVAIASAKVVGVENVYEPSRFLKAKAESYGPEFDRATKQLNMKPWPTTRPEPTPTFGSNDRSRWATIRALAEEGTYCIGERENHKSETEFKDRGIIFLDGYQSIDKVMDPETGRFYSSKPPLMPTVLAGEYWLLMQMGLSIDRDRWLVMGIILFTVNVIPFGIYLWFLGKLIDEYATTDFARIFAFSAAAFGTFLLTFSMTLNNHVPAACCTLFAVYPLLAKRGGEPSGFGLFTSGFFAALTVTLELQAAALLVGLFVPLLIAQPKRTLLYFLPGALLPLLAHFAANYAAMGQFMPTYAKFGGPWYVYPGSHWAKTGDAARGIDFIKESTGTYAFHMSFGHHGWFSLTPIWLVGAAGLIGLAWRSGPEVNAILTNPGKGKYPWTLPLLGALTVAITGVMFLFFIFVTTESRNYGGNTAGLRWFFWVTPLWILGLLPAADRLSRSSLGQGVAAVTLGFSVLSVFYPAWNPWRGPWVMQLMQNFHLIDY